jgi:DNA-binding transcriptional ArsR family regulator
MALDGSALAAIASPRRREILRLTWDREVAAGEIARAMPDVTFGAVSLQLRALVQAGLLECRPDKTQRFYRARQQALGPVGRMLEGMWTDGLWRLKLAAELEQTRRGPSPARRRPIKQKNKKTERTR